MVPRVFITHHFLLTCYPTYFVNHCAFVKHVWVEEAVPESNVIGHLLPVWRHPRQHWSDQRVAKAEGSRSELVENTWVASEKRMPNKLRLPPIGK